MLGLVAFLALGGHGGGPNNDDHVSSLVSATGAQTPSSPAVLPQSGPPDEQYETGTYEVCSGLFGTGRIATKYCPESKAKALKINGPVNNFRCEKHDGPTCPVCGRVYDKPGQQNYKYCDNPDCPSKQGPHPRLVRLTGTGA